jgi:hypothetical protein
MSPLYSHSFSEDFYSREDDKDLRRTSKPLSVEQALHQMTDDEWEELALNVFDVDGKFLTIEEVMSKIYDTDTVEGLSSPITVWIDDEGYYTVDVYDAIDAYNKRLTLCFFLYDYHSGQWSRGYELACKVRASLADKGIHSPLDINRAVLDHDYYDELVEKYREKV